MKYETAKGHIDEGQTPFRGSTCLSSVFLRTRRRERLTDDDDLSEEDGEVGGRRLGLRDDDGPYLNPLWPPPSSRYLGGGTSRK